MSYQSNLPKIRTRFQQATDAGLRASAAIVADEVKKGLEGGYGSGAFATGESVEGVKIGTPEVDRNGAFIRVGTDLLHNLFWEIGAYSAYTRRYERKEVWMPALLNTRQQQLAEFERAYAAAFAEGKK